MVKENKPSKIPDFKSYEEEAEFWDTHDISEFEDEFKPVKVRFAKQLSDPGQLKKISERLGMVELNEALDKLNKQELTPLQRERQRRKIWRQWRENTQLTNSQS